MALDDARTGVWYVTHCYNPSQSQARKVMPELRVHFAENLKRLLRQEKSIAHVCRTLDINRQQFNRYLAGDALPGKRNIKKIAQYFHTSEASLISASQESGLPAEGLQSEPLFERLSTAFNEGPASLRAGLYFFYFPSAADRTKCLRGLMVLKRRQSVMQFDAALSLRPAHACWRAGSLLRYSGLVRERAGKTLFLGTDRNEPGDIFLVNIEPVYSSRGRLFIGLTTSVRAGGIDARRIAIEYAYDQTRLCAQARKSGIVSVENSEVDPWVRAAISADGENDAPLLLPKDLSALVSG
jgi:transcriptional regulator with XRE-family HTH domain